MNQHTIFILFFDTNFFFLGRVLLIILIMVSSYFCFNKAKIQNNYVIFILEITLVFLLFLYILSYFSAIFLNLWYCFILIYAYLTLLMYVLLYSWRKLEVSLGSLLRIYGNLIIFNLFILGLYNLGCRLSIPIYVENLSVYSVYKYILFLSSSILGILGYIILKNYFADHLHKIDYLTFPYLKEEVRIFLYTWNESVFGPIFTSLIDLLYTSAIKRYIYFITHFVLFYFFQILQTILFLNFVFFHGDLRWNFYVLPFSFFSWLLRFFEYYFNTFLKGTDEYISACLNVSLKDPLTPLKNSKVYFLNGNDLNFELTPFAIAEGFQNDHNTIVYVGTHWLRICHIMHFFNAYEKKLSYLSKLIFFTRIFAWFSIIYIYFSTTLSLLNWKFLVSFRPFYSSAKRLAPPPREAFTIHPKTQTELQSKTQGAYHPGHCGVFDSDKKNEKGEVLFEASLTHGPGSEKNPSQYLSETDLQGKGRPQKATFPKQETFIDPHKFLKEKIEPTVILKNLK